MIKTLKIIRPEGFNSETTSVGHEIINLIKILMDEFDFKGVLFNIEGLPQLINCLTPKSARKCCLNQILPKLTELTVKNVKKVVKLFGCLSKTDLIQLTATNYEIEELKQVTKDLDDFSNVLISLLSTAPDADADDDVDTDADADDDTLHDTLHDTLDPADTKVIMKFYQEIDSSSSCLNLFLLPKLLYLKSFNESFYKILISSMLKNTSTVLPQRLEETTKELDWIEPEFTKLMAVKMNLIVIEKISETNNDPYEFYSEVKKNLKESQ